MIGIVELRRMRGRCDVFAEQLKEETDLPEFQQARRLLELVVSELTDGIEQSVMRSYTGPSRQHA